MKRVLFLAAALFLSLGAVSYGDGLLAPCAGVFCNGPSSLTANLPIIGNGSGAPTTGTRSGNTTVFATTSGVLTNGNCVSIDSNGNLVDAGGACSTGGGGGTVSSGTAGQMTYYASTGTTVAGNANATISAGALTLGQASSVLGQIKLSGSTSGTTTLTPAVAASGTLTLPAATDTLVGRATTDTLTNKTISGSSNTLSNIGNSSLTNSSMTIAGHVIALGGTQAIACGDLSNGATGCSTATGTSGATLPLLNGTNTWSGVQSFNSGDFVLKGSSSGTITLNAPAAAGSNILTLPAATDTLIGKATTDTLTNKTFDTAGTGNSFSINGLAATANTGTGAIVRATSPTLVTPALGAATATSINFGGGALATFVPTTPYTPTLSFGGASVGVTYTAQVGYYTQIGPKVHSDMTILLSSKGSSSGQVGISLPVAAVTATAYHASCSIVPLNLASGNFITADIASGASVVLLNNFASGTSSSLTNTNTNNTSQFDVSCDYLWQ